MYSPFQQACSELFKRSALLICRQSPVYSRDDQTYPTDYVDVRNQNRVVYVELDTPSDREPAYQFFGRKRLLLRVCMESGGSPPLCPGDTIEMLDETKVPTRYLLANYAPTPFAPRVTHEVAQFVAYEMDQDVDWEQRSCGTDPVTGLAVDTAATEVVKTIPVTLETLYEERDRSLVTKEDRRRVITGAPLKANDFITLHGSSERGDSEVKMKILRVEFLSGVYVCEAQ